MFSFLIFVLIAMIGFLVFLYNALQNLGQDVREKDSNIKVAVATQVSLTNQLIDLVKNYQESEQLTHLKISQDNVTSNVVSAYQQAGTTFTTLQGIAERFPNLKASEQYQKIMTSISQCEADVQQRRQAYNAAAKTYNQRRLSVPTVFIAKYLGFSAAPYLEFDISGNTDTSLKNFKTDDGERLNQLLSNMGSSISGATKSIASQASKTGKTISERISGSEKEPDYFYMVPGGIPKGPVPLNEIKDLIALGNLPNDTLVLKQGKEEWQKLID